MYYTKKWGTVTGSAELYMLNHAEKARKQLQKKQGKDGVKNGTHLH